ncbi:MAG: SWIM zinc finger family protein [Clostridia bacterium]|nr:SWIM zinc finger family protein [Clostridia bacterium]
MSIETAANRKSASRGYQYYCDNKVKSVAKIDDTHYSGEVSGSGNTPYSVTINLEHPKRSKCTCPFANGHKVCKHMVSLYFEVLPKEAEEYIRRIEEAENEREEFFEELPYRIEAYVRGLSKSELQELALSLIGNLSEYELEEFALYHLDNDLEYDFDEYDCDEDYE